MGDLLQLMTAKQRRANAAISLGNSEARDTLRESRNYPDMVRGYVKLKFAATLLGNTIRSLGRSTPKGLTLKQKMYLAFVLSKSKGKNDHDLLTLPENIPFLRGTAANLFCIAQRAKVEINVEEELMVILSGNETYRFRLMLVPDRARANFRHNLFPFVDVFFARLYDYYDFGGGEVIDVGAYIGDSAVYFVKHGASKVYAYEPNPVNYEYLVKNIQMNGVSEKVESSDHAVSLQERQFVVPNTAAGSGSLSRTPSEKSTSFDVSTIEPKGLFKKVGTISLLKLDCKGCELELFETCMSELEEKVNCIIADVGHLKGDQVEGIVVKLRARGFRLDANLNNEYIYLSKDKSNSARSAPAKDSPQGSLLTS
jgi:FkbM family methyltransferase